MKKDESYPEHLDLLQLRVAVLGDLGDGLQILIRALLLTEHFMLIGIKLTTSSTKKFFLKFKIGRLPVALETFLFTLSVLSSNKEKFGTLPDGIN